MVINMKARELIRYQMDAMEDSGLVVVKKRNSWIDATQTVRANSDKIEAKALNGRGSHGSERVIKLRYPAELEVAVVRALKETLSIETDQRRYV